MKQFEPYQKVLHRRNAEGTWFNSNYQFLVDYKHTVIGIDYNIADDNILPYEGNEYLLGKVGEPTPKWTPKEGDPVVYWDDSHDTKSKLTAIRPYVQEMNGMHSVGINNWDHVALVLDLSELGKPISYFKNRGFWV